jgi:hypothetical protein
MRFVSTSVPSVRFGLFVATLLFGVIFGAFFFSVDPRVNAGA